MHKAKGSNSCERLPVDELKEVRAWLYGRPRLARPVVTRLGGVQRFAVRRHAETALQVGGAAVHEAGADDGMALEFVGEGFEERGPLLGGGSALRVLGRRRIRHR